MAEQSTKKAGDKAETSSKAKKKPEKKKDGLIAKISRFAKELRSEIKKIVWPTKKQVLNNTCVVGVVMIAVKGERSQPGDRYFCRRSDYVRNTQMVCCSHVFRV